MTKEQIPEPFEHPAKPEQPTEGFDEGQSARDVIPEDQAVGRFSKGQEELPASDPEKHVERRFSEGQDAQPPSINP